MGLGSLGPGVLMDCTDQGGHTQDGGEGLSGTLLWRQYHSLVE